MYLIERMVIVLPLKSFEDFREGEIAMVWMSERLANLIANDYLRLMWDPVAIGTRALQEMSHATDEGDNSPGHDVRPVT